MFNRILKLSSAAAICGALLFLAIRFGGIDPVGVLVGLSVVLPASLIGAWRMRPPIDPQARALEDSSGSEESEGDWGWDASLYADPAQRESEGAGCRVMPRSSNSGSRW